MTLSKFIDIMSYSLDSIVYTDDAIHVLQHPPGYSNQVKQYLYGPWMNAIWGKEKQYLCGPINVCSLVKAKQYLYGPVNGCSLLRARH